MTYDQPVRVIGPGVRSTARKVARVAACLVALALAVGPATEASAAVTVRITGGGFGHGLGMSQYGAYGQALAGRDSTEILTHYYTGTEVAEADVSFVRVGLLQQESALSLTSSAGYSGSGRIRFKVLGDSATVAKGRAGVTWRVETGRRGGVLLYRNDRKVTGRLGGPGRPLVVRYAPFDSLVRLTEKARSYAYGRLEIGAYASTACPGGFCLRAVVELPMQKYLYGLGEVPSSWPAEALEAQVIAARTYAHRKHETTGDHRDPCDCTILDSSSEQVYLGDTRRLESGSYWARWTGAVDATSGLVVLYNGQPINAMYSASSGGHTENNESIWGTGAVPYLRGVADPYDDNSANPYHEWTVTMSWAQFSSKLDAYFGTGELESFTIRTPLGISGRVTAVTNGRGGVRIVGSEGAVTASGTQVKSALGLRDTLFQVSYSS